MCRKLVWPKINFFSIQWNNTHESVLQRINLWGWGSGGVGRKRGHASPLTPPLANILLLLLEDVYHKLTVFFCATICFLWERTYTEAEVPILWPPDVKSWLIGKDPDAGKDWGQEENRMTEDEMVGRHHHLNGHESEQIPRDSEGQGSLAYCSPCGCKVQRVRHNWATIQQQ